MANTSSGAKRSGQLVAMARKLSVLHHLFVQFATPSIYILPGKSARRTKEVIKEKTETSAGDM